MNFDRSNAQDAVFRSVYDSYNNDDFGIREEDLPEGSMEHGQEILENIQTRTVTEERQKIVTKAKINKFAILGIIVGVLIVVCGVCIIFNLPERAGLDLDNRLGYVLAVMGAYMFCSFGMHVKQNEFQVETFTVERQVPVEGIPAKQQEELDKRDREINSRVDEMSEMFKQLACLTSDLEEKIVRREAESLKIKPEEQADNLAQAAATAVLTALREERIRNDEDKKAEEAKRIESLRLAEEAAHNAREEIRREEELRIAEEQAKRAIEEARLNEEKRIEEEKRRKLEEEREAQRIEESKRHMAEEIRRRVENEISRIEEERRVEEARIAEENRILEEAKKAEEARLAEEKRIADEKRIAEEIRLKVEEGVRKAEEARLLEEARKAEEARLAEEARRAAEEEARRIEEARKAEEARRAEQARLLEELRKADEIRRAAEERIAALGFGMPEKFGRSTESVLSMPVSNEVKEETVQSVEEQKVVCEPEYESQDDKEGSFADSDEYQREIIQQALESQLKKQPTFTASQGVWPEIAPMYGNIEPEEPELTPEEEAVLAEEREKRNRRIQEQLATMYEE